MARWPDPGRQEPPAELRAFRVVDWLGRCGPTPWYYHGGPYSAYLTPYEAWHLARVEWLKADHDRRIDGMDVIELVFSDEPA